jgi:hypothetical protein
MDAFLATSEFRAFLFSIPPECAVDVVPMVAIAAMGADSAVHQAFMLQLVNAVDEDTAGTRVQAMSDLTAAIQRTRDVFGGM